MKNYKNIPGYENYYINEIGNIISTKIAHRGKKIEGSITDFGYKRIKLIKNGEPIRTFVHNLVAISFIPNPNNKPCINHKDGDKLNNHKDNLEWCTWSENLKHAHITGLRKSGKKTIPKELIELIKVKYETERTEWGERYHSHRSLAIVSGLSKKVITKILNGYYD